jgi:DNA-binding response OmpR family regulator/anti-sigma regulatory factor (Ser/Thr protein kinase)
MNQTVLIVDDSLTVRMNLAEAFQAAGYRPFLCATAADAREVLSRVAASVIILDVLLPDGDGVDLLQEIRRSPSGSSAVIVMLSSEAEVRNRIRGLQTGADEYVGKPYDIGYLLGKVQELLQARQGEAAAATTILVIDDSATFREELRTAFESAGHRVLTAATGEEGLRIAGAQRPDAVVVDGMLPGIDGATVIRHIRLDAVLRDVPCLLLTAFEDKGSELRALDAGADTFVRKGEDLDVILARLAAVLRRGASRAPADEGMRSLLGPKKVLAVDDSVTYIHELTDALKGEGYDVVMARSGEEAIELLAVQTVDCILLDLMMPGLGGHETCRRIKTAPIVRDTPLIMLTALENREAMILGLAAGADDYIPKSSDFEVVKARVRAQIRRRQFEDENRRMREHLLRMELEVAEVRAAAELAELRRFEQTLQEQNVELEEASRLKSEFLANMSHELRTPLNSIIGFSEVLRDGLLGEMPEQQRVFIGNIFSSGTHLLSLINDILDLSKVEAGKMMLDLESVEVSSLLVNSVSIISEKAATRQIRTEVDAPDGLGSMQVDARKIKQIVYNLLSNAVKFTADGGHVTLRACRVARADVGRLSGPWTGLNFQLADNEFEEFLKISITDSGIGIPTEGLERLFQPFSQIDSRLARKFEGAGLGLAIVKRLADLHGGTVSVESAVGEGSCFVVWLPLRAPVEQALTSANAPAALVHAAQE